MNNKLFASFIVPVYNVEHYIEECINSILGQSIRNFELILVDDGSTDDSNTICNKYAGMDFRIRLFRKDNGGLSDARNYGLKQANGDYIFFVDGDDHLENIDVLKKLYNHTLSNNCDLIFFGTQKYFEESKKYIRPHVNYDSYKGKSPVDTLYELIRDSKINISACTFFIRREFLVSHNLFFKKGIKSEDIEWGFRLFSCLPSWGFISENLYVYRQQRAGSITSSVDAKHLNTYIKIIECSIESAKNIQNEKLKFALISYAMYHLLIYCGLCKTISISEYERRTARKSGEKLSKKYLNFYTLNKRVRFASVIYKLFGYHALENAIFLFLIFRKFIQKRLQ